MHVTRAKPTDGSRVWEAPDGMHIDVRGLDPPGPMIAILRMIDGGEVGDVLIAHLDREPIFLYPELDQRGWTHEIISSRERGEEEVQVRLVRLGLSE
jgi:TusA-related sulfurtransferase